VLLVAGYVLAVPPTLLFLRVAWRRWTAWFAALLLGCALIVAGWTLEGERIAAWSNAGWAFGFAVAWVVIGRIRLARERGPAR
jgi:hypothetical protein